MREPTSYMIGKACENIIVSRTNAKRIYGSMIDAALKE